MKDTREEWYDVAEKVAVTIADVTSAAQALARGHLSGPSSAYYLAKALAAAALLGGETSETDETLSIQMKCTGPLGGFNVECTSAGTLRGYTEKKILDDFDGMGKPNAKKVVGEKRIQVTRSVPGRIISQGISNSLDGYLAGSLQRRAVVHLEAAVTDDVEIVEARGIMIEALPDASQDTFSRLSAWKPRSLAVASRNLLGQLDLKDAEKKKETPLSFACRCSAERAKAMVEAMGAKPPTTVTCHMCGRSWEVK